MQYSYAPGQQEEWVIFSAYRQLMQFHVKHAMSHWFLLFLLVTLIMVFHVRACGQGFWSYLIFWMSHFLKWDSDDRKCGCNTHNKYQRNCRYAVRRH